MKRLRPIPPARVRRLGAALLLVASGTALPAAVGASSAHAASAFSSTVVNAGNGLCADEPGSTTTAGKQLIEWSCNSGSNQNFTFTPVGGTSNTYTVQPLAAGLCLDVSGRSAADGAQVIQWSCNGQTNQQFTLTATGGGYAIANVNSGKCLTPAGDAATSGTGLVQEPCTGAGTRVWQLSGFPSGGGSTCTGTCLQYNGGTSGTFTQSPLVYLVFYGSQWNGGGGATQSQAEGFFQGLGKGGETWSRILTQYCNNIPAGSYSCPAGAQHIPYPTSTVYAGTWFDSSQPAPPSPGDDLITAARDAAAHFNAPISRSIFVILSPAGTSAGGGYSWHTTTSDGYNVINAAYGWQDTNVLSHEYAETLTDVASGWTTADHTSEIADLCGPDGDLTLPTGSFPVVSLWSNAASACVISG